MVPTADLPLDPKWREKLPLGMQNGLSYYDGILRNLTREDREDESKTRFKKKIRRKAKPVADEEAA